MAIKIEFTKGQQVKFSMRGANGSVRGKGLIKALVPRGAQRGGARLTVVDAAGRKWRPFPSQCKAA